MSENNITTSIEPKPEHIERLMNNPNEYLLFDKKYGDGASLKYLSAEQVTAQQEQPEEEENKEPEKVSGFTGNILPGVQKGSKEFFETAQGISDFLKDKFPGLNYSVRIKDNPDSILPSFDIVSQETRDKEKEAGIDPFADEKAAGKNVVPEEGLLQGVANVIGEPETEAEGVVGNLTRGVSQFATGFVAGGSILKGLGWAKNVKGGYNVTRSFVQGGIADFTVFDEKEARLADFVIDAFPDAEDTFIGYMAADEDDTFFEGKLKNVIEGGIVGTAAELLFKIIRFSRGTRKRLDQGDIDKAKDYAEKQAKDIEETQAKVEEEQLELFPDDPRIQRSVDEVAEEAKGTAGVGRVKEFTINKLKGTDYFKNVQDVIKAIRRGDADVDDLEEIGVSVNFLGDAADAVTFVRVMAGEINKVTKEFDDVKSYDQVWREADNMLDNPENALIKANQLAKVTDKGDAIQIALRMAFNGVLKNHLKNDALHQIGKLSDDEILKSFDLLQTLYRLDRQIGKNTGRMLAVRKELVEGSPRQKRKTLDILEQAEIIPKGDGDKATLKMIEKVRKANKEKKGIMAVLETVRSKLGINALNKFWINALLSNPKTHMINMTSNTIMALLRPIEQAIGGALSGNKSAVIEAVNTAAGIVKFYTDSFYMAREAFKKSDSILDKNNFKVDLARGAFNKQAGFATKVVESPTRFLSAEDEFFKQLNYRAKVYGQAVAEGIRLGKSRKKIFRTADGRKYSELDAYVESRFDEAFLPNKEANPAFKQALEYAQENTFTKALGQGTPGKYVQDAVNGVPFLRQFMPFVRTPVNIMRAVQDRSPLGLARKQFRDEFFSPDRNIRAAAYGKQALGASLFAVGGVLAYNGLITGGIPKDKNMRRQKFDTGWRPYSFKLGDKYYSYERLDPFGMFFGLMADYYNIANEVTEDERNQLAEANMLALMGKMDIGDYTDIGTMSIMATARNITSKTYLKSLTDILSAVSSGDPREWKRYGLTKAGSFVPNIVKGFANDPLYRDARNLTDTLKTRVPFIGDAMPSYNVLGETRSRNQSWWDSFVNPFTVSEEKEDIVMKELDRLGVGFEPLGLTQGINGNIDLSNFTKDGKNAYMRWNEILSNTNLRKDLEKFIQSKGYDNILFDKPIDDELNYKSSKATQIKKIINQYKAVAREQLLREGFITENNLNLAEAYANDKRNASLAKIGGVLLPTK